MSFRNQPVHRLRQGRQTSLPPNHYLRITSWSRGQRTGRSSAWPRGSPGLSVLLRHFSQRGNIFLILVRPTFTGTPTVPSAFRRDRTVPKMVTTPPQACAAGSFFPRRRVTPPGAVHARNQLSAPRYFLDAPVLDVTGRCSVPGPLPPPDGGVMEGLRSDT